VVLWGYGGARETEWVVLTRIVWLCEEGWLVALMLTLLLLCVVFKGETFHGACLQKKLKEEKTTRRSMRGSVTNKNKVERVHAENMKVSALH
jgi:hypothetical protein